ncbi:hypothetical protein EV182_007820, partial [Spiromyces aspiralis]
MANPANAHDHSAPGFHIDPTDPIDGRLKAHIAFMALAYGVIFPIGMVLGLVKSRWHVPFQATGAVFTALGYIFGHTHKGRMFDHNAHAKVAWAMLWLLAFQTLGGIYLMLRLDRFINDPLRRWVKLAHKWMGVAQFILS